MRYIYKSIAYEEVDYDCYGSTIFHNIARPKQSLLRNRRTPYTFQQGYEDNYRLWPKARESHKATIIG